MSELLGFIAPELGIMAAIVVAVNVLVVICVLWVVYVGIKKLISHSKK